MENIINFTSDALCNIIINKFKNRIVDRTDGIMKLE